MIDKYMELNKVVPKHHICSTVMVSTLAYKSVCGSNPVGAVASSSCFSVEYNVILILGS